ncbi:MAG: hypothetical protein V1746_07770 [bacterium]
MPDIFKDNPLAPPSPLEEARFISHSVAQENVFECQRELSRDERRCIELGIYQGRENCLRIGNSSVAAIIAPETGLRILHFGPLDGPNFFKENPFEGGIPGHPDYRLQGGQRLCVAPEGEMTYALDNDPLESWKINSSGDLVLTQKRDSAGFEKQMTLSASQGSGFLYITNEITNQSGTAQEIATWSVSMMAPGGIAVARAENFKALQNINPNDPRIARDDRRIFVRQLQDEENLPGIKIGCRCSGLLYAIGNHFVSKVALEFDPTAQYADQNTSCQIFTMGNIQDGVTELELTSPLRVVQPGETIALKECLIWKHSEKSARFPRP